MYELAINHIALCALLQNNTDDDFSLSQKSLVLPSVSVALSIIFINLFFQDELLMEEFWGSKSDGWGILLPVPKDNTHCIGLFGHKSFASCKATAVGLFTIIPPSFKNSVDLVEDMGVIVLYLPGVINFPT